ITGQGSGTLTGYNGIKANSTGTGGVLVTNSDAIVEQSGANGTGISGISSGASGNVTILNTGAIGSTRFATDINANISAGGSTGTINVGSSGALKGVAGIVASNSGSGAVNVDSITGAIATTTGAGISASSASGVITVGTANISGFNGGTAPT